MVIDKNNPLFQQVFPTHGVVLVVGEGIRNKIVQIFDVSKLTVEEVRELVQRTSSLGLNVQLMEMRAPKNAVTLAGYLQGLAAKYRAKVAGRAPHKEHAPE